MRRHGHGHAGRIGQRQVALRGQRLGGDDRDLARPAGRVHGERLAAEIAAAGSIVGGQGGCARADAGARDGGAGNSAASGNFWVVTDVSFPDWFTV